MDNTVDIRVAEIPGSLFLLRNMPILIFHSFGLIICGVFFFLLVQIQSIFHYKYLETQYALFKDFPGGPAADSVCII